MMERNDTAFVSRAASLPNYTTMVMPSASPPRQPTLRIGHHPMPAGSPDHRNL
jgi:hypothetical protein